jgi:X-Pro dipeptidyl-peptidase
MMAAHRHPLIRLLAGASAAGALGLAGLVSAQSGAQVPATGTPTSATAPARPVFTDGQAQVVPAFADETQWIRERLWVETEFDSDGDGRPDRVHVDVTRPRQTETEGLKVPVVYESSPYFAGTSGPREFLWDVRQELGAESPPRASQPAIEFQPDRTSISNRHVEDWVPRGFAVVHSEAPGTGLSEGCPTVGGPPERLAPKAVIDWLNGRATGYRTIDGDGSEDEVAATWSTGKVGMIGTSYNGTLPIAAAVTGVEGLEAIIPIAPNTSYYHYYRSNGLVRHPGGWLGEDIDFLYDFVHSGDPAGRDHCNATVRDGEYVRGRDRRTGDYNDFWQSRDLRPLAGNIRAAVLMAHAFNDWNVVPEHSVRIYEALDPRVPRMAYFHQGGHGGAPPMELMNKWFTRFLYDVENGIEDGPRAWIVREGPPPDPNVDGRGGRGRGRGRGAARPAPVPYADYPNPEAELVVLRPSAGGSAVGGLAAAPASAGATGDAVRETLTDNVDFDGPALAIADASPHRLMYATLTLTAPVHISGTARVTARLASSKQAANLSVWLVVLPWLDAPVGPHNLITRGWADPQNHASLTAGGNYEALAPGTPLTPGEFVTLTFDLQPDDQIVAAGKRIGLMIFSSDRDFTLWPSPGTELTIDLAGTSLRLPVVGGAAAFETAVGR